MTTSKMEDPPLRPTGNIERFNIIRNQIKFYNNVQVTAWYSVPRSVLGASDSITNLVYAALRELINIHPILGVNVKDEETPAPMWARLDKIDLRDIVKIIESDLESTFDNWAQDGHRGSIGSSEELPLWRVVVAAPPSETKEDESTKIKEVTRFAVGFFFHHGIGDGLSGGAFHLTFLNALNRLITNDPKASLDNSTLAVVPVPKKDLLPNLEMKTPLPISILFMAKEIFKAFIYSPVDSLLWTGPPISTELPRPPITTVRSFLLPASIVDGLVSLCRREKTSVTALITILIGRKLGMMYPKYSHFVGTLPVSLRKFTGNTNLDIGLYVSGATVKFSSTANPPRGYIGGDAHLWDAARQCKKDIDAQSASPYDQSVGLLKFIANNFKGYFEGMLGTKRSASFEVSNLGLLDGGDGGEQGGRAYFDRVMFSQGAWTYGPPFCFCVATAKNGGMSVALSWDSSVAEDVKAEELLGWLEGELRGLVRE